MWELLYAVVSYRLPGGILFPLLLYSVDGRLYLLMRLKTRGVEAAYNALKRRGGFATASPQAGNG